MIWKSPIYKFRVPENEEDGENAKLKEIVIDVTGSAPPFTEPSEALKSVLSEIFKSKEYKKIDKVLEFELEDKRIPKPVPPEVVIVLLFIVPFFAFKK